MSRRRRRPRLPQEPQRARIEALSHEGRGICHVDGKTVFVSGALPDEEVMFKYTNRFSKYDEGQTLEVLEASPHRVEAECEFYAVCGGCSLQHMDATEQIKLKQSVLLDNLQHIGKIEAEEILPPLTGPVWGYRQKARLGVRYVHKKERVLVGFREKHSAFLADMRHCRILHPSLANRLEALSGLICSMTSYNRIAQIEVAIGDDATALIFRNLDPLGEADLQKLRDFGQQHDFQIYIQPKGPDTVTLVYPQTAHLSYRLPDQDLELDFLPNDFTQVNTWINQRMINRALELLDLQGSDSVLELFCGLGNFSLPIARLAGEVTAVEGDAALIERARANAAKNRIDNIHFHTANLMDEDLGAMPWLRGCQYDKVLLDPPRSGAQAMLPHIAAVKPERIVYVSCNPATLARDAGILVKEYGYRLIKAGVMDMFPHTAHVESIALFTHK